VNSRLGGSRARTARAVLVLLLLVIPLVGSPLTAPGALRGDDLSDAYARQKALEKQIAAQKDLLASLKDAQAKTAAAIAATSDKLDSVNADLADVKAAVSEATKQLAAATSRYYELVQQVRLLHEQLLWLQATQDQKAADLALRQQALAQRLSSAYQDSHTPLLAQLLGSGSLNDVLVTISYSLSVGAEDRELAERISADQKTLAALEATTTELRDQTQSLRDEAAAQRAEIAGQRSQLKAAQAKLQKLQDQTETLIASQQAAYSKYASDAKKASQILAEQQAAEASLSKLIDKLLAERAAAGSVPSVYNGTFRWPMAGTVTQEFGCTGFYWEPPLGDCAHFHRGIDIAAPYGTHIYAAGAGQVIFAGKSPYDIYGAYMVVIAHSSNLTSWYAHIQTSIPVRVGQYVSKGQLIAYEGTTGLVTGPHLHWAVQLNGSWVNPRLFL
jgi:murein DD-endopeptidase MepM/ murein hydrolase activator NlpD